MSGFVLHCTGYKIEPLVSSPEYWQNKEACLLASMSRLGIFASKSLNGNLLHLSWVMHIIKHFQSNSVDFQKQHYFLHIMPCIIGAYQNSSWLPKSWHNFMYNVIFLLICSWVKTFSCPLKLGHNRLNIFFSRTVKRLFRPIMSLLQLKNNEWNVKISQLLRNNCAIFLQNTTMCQWLINKFWWNHE